MASRGRSVNRPKACLKLSAYLTAGDVLEHFSAPRRRQAAIRRLRGIGIRKAYVEFYRGGAWVDEAKLREIRDDLRKAGLEAWGGICTTHGQSLTEPSTHGLWWMCFSSAKSRSSLERLMRMGARVFDDIIVDDFLCTACRCGRCRAAKGRRDWSTYYQDLMVEVAQSCIIRPAKEENPSVRLIIKYPQWYDRFHVFGYDVVRQSAAFDAVWVGTEIRDPRVEYVHQYEAFANYSYLTSVAGEKVEGAWFDYYNCYPEIYREQAYQSVLAGAPELILFSYSPVKYDRRDPETSALLQKRKVLERICSTIRDKQRVGIEAYKPPGSDPGRESFIFDYLGVLGLPVIVTSRRPSTESIFLPVQSLKDPGVADFLMEMKAGRTVLGTSGLLEGLAETSVPKDLFGLRGDPVGFKDMCTYRFQVEDREHLAEERVLLRSYLRPSRAKVLAEAVAGRRYPILTVNRIDSVTYVAACLDTFRYLPYHGLAKVTVAEPVSLVHLPQAHLDLLRGLALSPLGLSFNAPAKVGLYLYSDQGHRTLTHLAVENFSDQKARVTVKGVEKLELIAGRAAMTLGQEGTSIRLAGRDLAFFGVVHAQIDL